MMMIPPPPRRRELERLYWGNGDPGRWLSIQRLAAHYGVSASVVRRWMVARNLRPRTPKETWRKIQWCMRQGSNPDHFSSLEQLAADELERWGLTVGRDWLHNHKVGTASLDFFFPAHNTNLEIDSVWHTDEWRNLGRGPESDLRRDRRLYANSSTKTFRVMFDPNPRAASRAVARFVWWLRCLST